tara:strand:- start:1239 stop:2555 length:1317 start_codon:yes stop_codon:yes gene_type:complete
MKKRLSNLELTYQCEADFSEPDRYKDLFTIDMNQKLITQGAGLSYAAASFFKGTNTVNMRKFDRILNFSPDNETIEVEAGISLKKLFDFLTPRGYYLSIQPGWPDLCIGSLVATNVHGKNQYLDGIFYVITQSIKLYHPNYGITSCSRSENTEIFELTCGGLGLTGIILSACLKIKKLKGNFLKREIIPVDNLFNTVEMITEHRDKHDILMSWTNISNPRKNFGEGFLITGNFYEKNEYYRNKVYRKLNPNKSNKLRFKVFNQYSLPFINKLYYYKETRKRFPYDISLFDALYPFHNKGFYFDLFGHRGFIAQQILIPEESIFEFIKEFESIIKHADIPIVLSALKAFRGQQNLLNFNGNGFSLYCDFFNNSDSIKFLDKFNDLATDHGCISNIIRNSYLSAKIVKDQYNQYDEFKDRLYHFDPDRLFVSEISNRLEL